MDFANVGAQLAYWLGNIGQGFKGGWDGSGENGVDIGMPTGSPVYAVTDGEVKGHGYYGGGGVVSIREQPGRVWYYQHFDLIAPDIENGQTKQVKAGQLIGWSGGQTGYGSHPVTSLKYSNDGHGHGWPHIEVGVNAPWGGIWGGGEGPNVDPVPLLRQLAQTRGAAATGNAGLAYQNNGGSNASDSAGGDPCAQYAGVDPRGWLCRFQHTFSGLFRWLTDPLRFVKLAAGGVLLVMGGLFLLIPSVAGTGLEIGGAATGQPEVAAAGQAVRRGRSNRQRGQAAGRILGIRRRDEEREERRRQQQAEATRRAETRGREAGGRDELERQRKKRSDAAKKAAQTRRQRKAAAS